MKKSFMLLAGLAALAVSRTAVAQTNIIRITGAQADRATINAAIGHILNPGYLYGFAGGSLSGANQAEFRGTTIAGNFPVDIKTSLIGSTGGIQILTTNITISSWFNATNLTSSGTSGITGPTETALADISVSDSFQSSTLYTSPLLNDQVIGVTAYVWAKNAGSPSTISNITPQLAQALLGPGQIPLSQFTANPADENTLITIVGRDENAGQRLVAFAESGFGIFSAPYQYQAIISGTPGPSGTITGIQPYPANTVNGVTYPVGHSGYSTGSSVAAVLNTPGSLPATGGWLLSYLAIGDALTVTNQGAGSLTYNGVPFSQQAVQEGQYSFWAYTHLFYRSGYSGTSKTIADQLATQIKNVDSALTGTLLSNMKVGRQIEGGVITFGSPY